MGERRKGETKQPIMSEDEQKSMAFEGLVQWSQACFDQATRTYEASSAHLNSLKRMARSDESRSFAHRFHTQCHFFAIAAFKLIEFRAWVHELGLCSSVDFGEIDRFEKRQIVDLRNMREHVVDYFGGTGRDKDRWVFRTAGYAADASSVCGVMIGGRLDYMAFGLAASRLHSRLLLEPPPTVYPKSAEEK